MQILCIEDDEGLLYLLRQALENARFLVTEALSGVQGLHLLQEGSFDVILIDHEMPMMTGIEVIRQIQALHYDVPIIMLTGAGNEEIAVQALRSGASDYLVKDTSLGYLKILPLVIQRVIAERELNQAHQAAERALHLEKERSKLLSQFIQNASHEFRTPLTMIKLSSYLLGQTSEETKQQTYISRIQTQADAILNLVEHLVQLARLDSTTAFNLVSVDLKALLGRIVRQKSELMAAKKLALNLDLPEKPVPLLANGDELADALGELINNACRYSNLDGVIHITLRCENMKATITIRDTGIGMTNEQITHIFERFYRVDEAHSTRGFGLGLPIAARIIELHHGEITVVSELGKGTSVVVSLPTAVNGQIRAVDQRVSNSSLQ